MQPTVRTILITLLSFTSLNVWALNQFYCQCQAQGPGYEETNAQTGGIDKICSYSCSCIGWDLKTDKKTGATSASTAIPNIKVNVTKAATTAFSRERWDAGSHVCHGQYSYKPNLSDDNWKITVKFDTFGINQNGDVLYPDNARREIAQGINEEGFKYSKKALEIAESLKTQLKDYKN
jgi:hypothetical protein